MMEILKVMPWGEGQGDHVLINAEDFDPDFHKLYVEVLAELPSADEPKKRGRPRKVESDSTEAE